MVKILISSRQFYPSIGGSETNAEVLAREFMRVGHMVKVVTQTPGNHIAADGLEFPFNVIRQSSPTKLLKLVNWCDVYFHNGVILRDAWPLLIYRKPWIIRHQTWIQFPNEIAGKFTGWKIYLKHLLVRFSISISISKSIAAHLQHPSTIIPNPYRDDLFRVIPEVSKTKELVFLGRLVSDKGVELLIEALAGLKLYGLMPQLTIIGSGSEELKLRQKTSDLGIIEQVTFVGSKIEEDLVRILNEHQIIVIPSLWDEPFGIVALEGIACGCVVIGSEGGGLKDAIGPCGVTFPNADVKALREKLVDLLTNPNKLAIYRAKMDSHLLRHKKSEVAKVYLQVIEASVE